jgi:hypothetical protein
MISTHSLPFVSKASRARGAPIRGTLAIALTLSVRALGAQTPPDLATERAGYTAWLKTAPNSPLKAVANQPIGGGLRLGPEDADIPLTGLPEHRIRVNGTSVTIQGPNFERPISRGHPFRVGTYALYVSGNTSTPIVTVFQDSSVKQPPGYYGYDPALVFTGPLTRLKSPERIPILASDGTEAEGVEVGSFMVPLAGGTPLRVLRIPVAGSDESELEIFFQDATNDNGSYPAGRFVSLIPAGESRYRLDFNRARNPYCAYSSVYPCPAPWRGNQIKAEVAAGERYSK